MLELAPHLQAALTAGRTVVVPSAQRAAALRLGFATQQLSAGLRAFRTPDVQSLSGWLRGQPVGPGSDGRALRRLGASEEWLLWREAVASSAVRLSLPQVPGLVDAVRRAAGLLHEWQIAPEALRQAGTPEAALLGQSLAALQARLAELSAAPPWLALRELSAKPPRRRPQFAGFTLATPAQRALFAAWGPPADSEPASPFAAAPAARAYAADPAAELELAAQWCRRRLQESPGARLLVIVPELADRRSEVQRVFDAALDADHLQRGDSEPDTPGYALEGGQPLASYAPVAEGLRTLRLVSGEVELAEVSQWLRGPYWTRPAAGPRAQLDGWLRTVVPPRLGAAQLLQALRAAPPALLAAADEVATLIERLLEALDGSPATFGTWSARFARALALSGLNPGAARQRASHTQQVLQRLEELLQECAALAQPSGALRAGEALTILAQLLAHTPFEPATGDVAVTLSAALDDPIVRYDGIWVSGLHAGAIPDQARFDPLIPAYLQRAAGIIRTDAAALVGLAQRRLAALCRGGREFIVSAAAHAADLELTASPLLAPYSEVTYSSQAAPSLARTLRGTGGRESYADQVGLHWPQALPLPSGTRAIELQSRCPFRAYAQLRLGAEPLEAPQPGITPRERGRLLHRALELLWQRLGGSAGLAAARAARSLGSWIDECIAQATGEILTGADPEFADGADAAAADATGLLALRRAAIARERDRAARLIGALCELEASRPPFTIHELEGKHGLQIGAARIDVRIDRIDRLEDGGHAIVDYKSGRALSPDWELDRTTHPQLLVYLLAAGVPVSALAVAHLEPKAVVFRGIGDTDGRLPGVKAAGLAPDATGPAANWAHQVKLWREQVLRLADDFVRGEARVDPMEGACDYCHLQAFCRIAEANP